MPIHLSPGWPKPVAAVAVASASIVAAAALAALFLSTALDAFTAAAAAGPAGPADGILLITGLGGAVMSLWVGLGTALSALSALPGALGQLCRRLASRIAPAAVRKVVAFVLGTTLTAALVPGTAVAGTIHEALRGSLGTSAQQPVHTGAQQAGHTGAQQTVQTGTQQAGHAGAQQAGYPTSGVAVAAPDASFRFVSGRPPVQHPTDAAPLPGWSPDRTELRQESVVVLRGDTLWSIAADHLGPAARAADINTEVYRWLAFNREVIGDDADLILPGQLLRPPPSSGARS